MEKLIITIAHTGNVPTKEMNPNTPVSVREIVDDIKQCVALGASVAHIHVRDENQMPTSDRGIFKQVLNLLDKEKVNVVRQLSTGARGGENTVDWRGQMLDLSAEMASLSTGSSNFPTSVNANSPELVEALALKMKDNGIKPEIEAFDLAMITNAKRLLKKGILTGPLHFNFVMNVPGSIEGTPKNLMYMIDSIPEGSTWNVTAVGRSQVELIPIAIAMGGHVRTGLEDVIEYEKGIPASNAMLVERVVRIAKAIGRPIANPDDVRKILQLNKK
ncbi:3-keto-5-aminohexanoate cleavage protein [Sinanaerobacter chloroacetimidivorans]|jgi:3-keto-5-aminohexanoate cleavage enzyme|uniref:3-keto-5-aminohexanoate cleavage protein n=1 Tax=Sinanaerobacter chloroacetimidivorans TaxID=2818044 RepID=A0A8J7W4A7_9FIRM|nr:3-keto-5-aminohexanoate cleavage protein [Sinanaerobacter chloroacetimidivorans]MBR0600629.1 3-keto-5-aminohexanoate cleavage protein [Sinanaerobacter chloroacetimidivorans]